MSTSDFAILLSVHLKTRMQTHGPSLRSRVGLSTHLLLKPDVVLPVAFFPVGKGMDPPCSTSN